MVRPDEGEGLAEWLALWVARWVALWVALAAGELGWTEDVAVAGCVGSTLEVAGLNVATDSIAPATRHTARMLASSGMTLPRAANGANGPASRRSRWRRRCARSSRW